MSLMKTKREAERESVSAETKRAAKDCAPTAATAAAKLSEEKGNGMEINVGWWCGFV